MSKLNISFSTIEKDNYEAAVLQAEAEVTRAEAKLIEEQALADVAADEAKRNGRGAGPKEPGASRRGRKAPG